MAREISPIDGQVIDVTSTAGFSAGDYIYATSTGYQALSTVPFGSTSTRIAGTLYTSPAASVGQSALVGPQVISGTYSGTSITPAGLISSSSITVNSQAPVCAALTSGRFVVARVNSSGNIFATVYNANGTVFTAETQISTGGLMYFNNSYGTLAVAGTSDGAFVVGSGRNGGASNGFWIGKFNEALVSQWTNAQIDAGNTWAGACQMIALPNGNIVWAGQRNSSGFYYVFNSSGVTQTSASINSGSSSAVGNGLNLAAGTNYWYSINKDQNNNTSRVSIYDLSGSYINAITSPYNGNQQTIAVLPNNNVLIVDSSTNQGSALNWQIRTENLGSSVNSNSINCNFGPSYIQNNLYAATNTQFVQMGQHGSNGTTQLFVQTSTTTGTTYQAAVASGAYCAYALGLNNVGCLIQVSGGITSGTVNFINGGPTILNNGASLSGSITYPTYTFVGVAVTPCSAGGTGKVLIRGTTNVRSVYGSSSSLLGFNATPSGSPVANQGSIIGRTITLEGQ